MSLTTTSSANFKSILDDALDSYAKQTGIDLIKHPSTDKLQNCRSPDDVLRILSERESAFKDYRGQYRNLIGRVRPVVQVVHAFSAVLGEAAGLVPFQPAKAIFVGVDVLLSAAIGVSASYDALADLFECVANFLRRFHIYTEKISLPLMMSDIIVKIMVEVLSVLALATKQINQGRFKKFAKKLLGESDVEAVLRRLDRLTQEEARVTVAHTLEVVHGLFDNLRVVMDDGKASTDGIRQSLVLVQETADRINKLERSQFQKDVRSWLSPPDPSTNHNIARRDRLDGTTSWFTESGTYREWKETGSLLWIHGKPGSGKSILCSGIIQDVKGLRDTGLAYMTYFYCDFRDAQKQQVSGLLASLIAQLSAKSDACRNILSALYSECDVGSRQPSEDELMDCLMDILKLEEQPPIYIIIDGLDECPNDTGVKSPRERVLEQVEKLVISHLPNVRICVTSRPEADIQLFLTTLTSHSVSLHEEEGQKKDIADYVRWIVYSDRNMRRWREEDKEMVVETLSRRADGMFRWVVCQVETLRRCFPSGIRRALDELPRSLDETYDRILLGIAREKQEYAQRLLQCLAESIRPLRTDELAEILAIQFETGILPNYDVNWRPEHPEEAVLSACSSLITIVDMDASRVVQFSHFSVKEYLLSERLANTGKHISQYHILSHSAHTVLAQASLSVLLVLDDQVDKERMNNFPLAIYAARYWVDHAQFDNVFSSVKVAMERLFDPTKPQFSTWVWIYDIDHRFREIMFKARPTPPEAIPLYYATLCGFRDLVEHLIITYPQDINARGGYYSTPLHTAVVEGNIDIMMLLLEHGADVNAVGSDGGVTPLHEASQRGRLDMMSLLFDHHADVDSQDKQGVTALMKASLKGELEVAQALLRHGAATDISNPTGSAPLLSASRSGHSDVVRLLLQNGATVDLQNKDGWTPLMLASRFGYPDVVRSLLQNGANVDSRSNDSLTALMAASRFGHPDVARLLLENGANVDSRSNDWTPLMMASQNGYPDVIRLLLENGAIVDSRNNVDWTPLMFASRYEQPDAVRLLLQNGANVDLRNNEGWTPLMLASRVGHLDVIRLLLQNGANVDSRNNNGQTLLALVSGVGHLDVIRLFLQNGANIDSQDNVGQTPLMLASRTGLPDVVRLLLQNGASTESQNNDGWTALMAISEVGQKLEAGHLDVIDLLLKNGATVDSRNKLGRTPLMFASRFGQTDFVRLLLQNGANVDSRDITGSTPLLLASGLGHLDVVRLLLENGASVDSRNKDGWTPLLLTLNAVGQELGVGHLGVIDLLLKNGASVESRNKYGRTPLALASQRGHLDTVLILLWSGASVDSRNNDCWPPSSDSSPEDDLCAPLHLASAQGHFIVAELLIQYGANLDIRNRNQLTPLHLASHFGQLDTVRLLLASNSGINLQDFENSTPLHQAAQIGHLDIVTLLLWSGASVNTHDSNNKTPLDLALDNGRLDVARFLAEWVGYPVLQPRINISSLDAASQDSPSSTATPSVGHGNDPNISDERRTPTSLHAESNVGHLDCVRSLLEAGADVNERDEVQRTPLHFASSRGYVEIAKLLIEYGADVNSLERTGWTPLQAASHDGHVDIVHLLLDHGADVNAMKQNHVTALHFAIPRSFEIAKTLLEHGADIHVRDNLGQTPFQIASQMGLQEIARLLLEYGVDASGV